MSTPTFVCPACATPHRTLRDLLTCCPRALRALTEACGDPHDSLSGIDLRALLTGAEPGRVARFLARRRDRAAA